MEGNQSPSGEEQSGSPQSRLILHLKEYSYGPVLSVSVTIDMVVRDLAIEFWRATGRSTSGPSFELWAEDPDFLIVELLDSKEIPIRRLDIEATLRDLQIQDNATLIIRPAIYGAGLPALVDFIGAAISSGVVGNAAYELLKAGLRRVRVRWRQENDQLLSKDEAVELTHACLCLKFDIDKPEGLQLLSADPVTMKYSGEVLESLRSLRSLSPGLRRAAYWRCTYGVQEEGLPTTVTVLIGTPPGKCTNPNLSVMFLLPN